MAATASGRGPNGEKWFTKRAAQDALRAKLVNAARGELVDPSRQPCGDYLDEWAAGLRLPRHRGGGYRKNIRLHLRPGVGTVPLAALTTEGVNALYRELERPRPARPRASGERPVGRAPSGTSTRSCRPRSPPPASPTGWPTTLPPPRPAEREAGGPRKCRRGPRLSSPRSWAGPSGTPTPTHRPGTCSRTHRHATGGIAGAPLARRRPGRGTVSVRRSAGMVRVAGEVAEVAEGTQDRQAEGDRPGRGDGGRDPGTPESAQRDGAPARPGRGPRIRRP